MTAVAVLGLLAGLAAATLLVLSEGVAGIWHSAAALGVWGFAAVVAYHLALIAQMGTAWWVLARAQFGPAARLRRYVWGRLIRDSASETLPLSPVGGYVLGVRATALAGVPVAFAAGSTVMDVTVEVLAQLLYTVLGLALLQALRPHTGLAVPLLLGVLAMSAAMAAFVAVQARGAGWIERAGARIARQFLGRDLGGAGAVQACIHALHRRPGALLLACAIHLGSWLLNGVETWLTLRLMGVPIGLAAALTIDALLYGIRSAAFMVPNALGVQEGGFILLGGLFGIPPDAALALSLIKRARDLVIGVPALLAWQALEGRRAWRRGAVPGAASRRG